MARRVLIIDDEAPIRRLLQMALEANGDHVGLAADGQAGLDLFGDGLRWDAVLLDQRLPGPDGLQTLARIKERNRSVPVIMVTAFASIELAVDAMKLGASDFIRKPLTPETLRRALDAAVPPRRAPTPTSVERRPTSVIGALTMNGYRLVHQPSAPGDMQHRFRVLYGSADAGVEVSVAIDPAAVERINGLTSRRLDPAGSFWKYQAEKLLAAYLWSEGKPPPEHTLVVRGVSREDLRAASTWPMEGDERRNPPPGR
jgi:DNA-binding response OmpR family regulator